MLRKNVMVVLTLVVAATSAALGQTQQSRQAVDDARATPAYEVLVLQKVTVEADLYDLRSRFTADSPTFRTKRFELAAITREMERLQTLGKTLVPKLTRTYGDLALRKVALEVQLTDLRSKFTDDCPDLKRTRTELAVLEREMDSLLR